VRHAQYATHESDARFALTSAEAEPPVPIKRRDSHVRCESGGRGRRDPTAAVIRPTFYSPPVDGHFGESGLAS
jgi:hypothetical protein